MCRTGGRRCPTSRTRAHGGTRGQPGDTTPPGGTGSSTPPPRPAGLNIVTGNATVGGQYEDANIHGTVTITPGSVVITGPVTGTPSSPPTAGQVAAAEAAAARALETARNALRAAEDADRSGHTTGGTVNVAGDGDVIAVQTGGQTHRY